MRLENDMKLDYKDVLILSQTKTLRSRREVTLERTYTFRHSTKTGPAFRSWLQTWMASGRLASTMPLLSTNYSLVL